MKTPDSTSINSDCIAAFMSIHITSTACGLYMENIWLWVADHDVEDSNLTQISIYAGRGMLIESATGHIWMYGTAVEHHTLYQYQVANVGGPVYMGYIQTESPYYQPNPSPPVPFTSIPAWNDPIFASDTASSWGLRVVNSSEVYVYGAGLYSFFSNYNSTCSSEGNGEWCQERILSVENTTSFSMFGLQTVGTNSMITVNDVDGASYADNLNGFSDAVAVFRLGSW
jgi:glucan 1,3-beta-glucosidase